MLWMICASHFPPLPPLPLTLLQNPLPNDVDEVRLPYPPLPPLPHTLVPCTPPCIADAVRLPSSIPSTSTSYPLPTLKPPASYVTRHSTPSHSHASPPSRCPTTRASSTPASSSPTFGAPRSFCRQTLDFGIRERLAVCWNHIPRPTRARKWNNQMGGL